MERYSAEWWRDYRKKNGERLREYKRKYDSNRWKTHPETERARRRRYEAKYPDRVKANHKLNYALRKGEVIKQVCEVCGDTKTIAHHDDYSKPLEVIWLCEIHHKERHKYFATHHNHTDYRQ